MNPEKYEFASKVWCLTQDSLLSQLFIMLNRPADSHTALIVESICERFNITDSGISLLIAESLFPRLRPNDVQFLKAPPGGFGAASLIQLYKIFFVITVIDQDGPQRSGRKLWNQPEKCPYDYTTF